MKRRATLRLIPLSLAGVASSVNRLFSQEMHPMPGPMGMPLKKPPAEPLAIRYTKKVRGMLTWIRHTQSENLLEASYAIASAVKEKRTCWSSWDMGHSISADIIPNRIGNPDIFRVGFDAQKAKKGEPFLANIWGGNRQDLIDKEIFVIGGPAPWSGDAKKSELLVRDSAKLKMRPYSHIWIETNVDTIGAVMKVPGMPAPVGPVSGIIGMVTYWMMMADTCRILARDGISVRVFGDEPKLSGDNVEWVSLHAPLMDDYFDEAIEQIETIGAELGNIRETARMAVDSVLNGGKVWCYSRYSESLASESSTRRGGLALTQGVYESDGKLVTYGGDLKGTSKDLVIMGIYAPDDSSDIKALDQFRKSGMKVVSIGPLTRGIKIPSGRSIPKEADIHIGRMCDTYGLFAIPGFDRKICPTSGAMVNQIFWAICLEIVEEMVRRTGNVPGVFFSAAIKGGTEHMHRIHELYSERGY
ncbi:hypothetical protein ACFL1R_02540 [Candidatus Latescibacterota bacterium]